MLDSSVRRSLGNGSELGSRRILSLCKAIDLIVEKDDVYIDIPSDGMDEVVTSDSKGITVTAGLSYGKIRIGYLDSGRNGGSTAVNAVEAVSIHIIWKT